MNLLFQQYTASAAALNSKKTVSAESFTCLYGWKAWRGPAPYEKKEQVADMKLVADALFANGVNMIIWHGMPYNPKGEHNEFYATVHVGPDSYFADEIPAFNGYMQKVSQAMREGKTYTDVAVYFPLEDIMMSDTLDSESQNVGVGMKHVKLPESLKPYHPLWISGNFLKDCTVENKMLKYKDVYFNSLYIDIKYMDYENLIQLFKLARQGLPVCLKNNPKPLGIVQANNFKNIIKELLSMRNVSNDFNKINTSSPLLTGNNLYDYWCKVTDNGYTIFFSNPKANNLQYPLKYGQSLNEDTFENSVQVKLPDNNYVNVKLKFMPYQSILMRVSKSGKIEFEDINFEPKKPVLSN